MLVAALALGLLASALSAGFLWAWSFTVMPGLAAAPSEAAVAAMRAVNASIAGPGFAFVFFGPGVFAALAAALAFAAGLNSAALPALAAAALYGAGVVAVTFAGPWTTWNHLRTAAASLAFVALAASGAVAVRG